MNISFIITFLASISTILGSLIVFKIKNINNIVTFLFSFITGIIILVCLIDLLPTSYKIISTNYSLTHSILIILATFLIGYLLLVLLDSFQTKNDKLYNVGIIATISIIMHNIPEGIITYVTSSNDIKLGISMAIMIAIHNIPEGILISLPIYLSTKKKGRAFIYTLIAGISEFFGAIISYFILENFINSKIGIIYALVSGIMISLIVTEIIPYIRKNNNLKKTTLYLAFIMGVVIIFITNIIFH